MIDYESRYYNLLHILKAYSGVLEDYKKGLMTELDFEERSADFIEMVDSEFKTVKGESK